MSFDLFVQTLGDTRKTGLPVSAVRSRFPVVREEPELNCWLVEYDSLNQSVIYVRLLEGDKERQIDFSLSRPCGGDRFWDALFSILQMGLVVAFWPGSKAVFAEGADLTGVADEMIESLGGPVFVGSGAEVLRLVQQT
jgi:hypothetical protein